jgi:hypothetical protein
MQSEIKNERFTLIAEKKCFRDILNAMADALDVKRPEIHAKPFDGNTLRLDWFVSNVFQQKKIIKQLQKLYGNKLYSNQKIKDTLKTDFINIHFNTLKKSLIFNSFLVNFVVSLLIAACFFF